MQKEHFYNLASNFYDKMIPFSTSLTKRINFYDKFLDKNKIDVADIGCGTGLDSVSLASLGFNVFAFDISREMINIAKVNAVNQNVKINFFEHDLSKKSFTFKKFNYIFSMGNTIANINIKSFNNLLINIKKMLKTDGLFIFQIVNYDKILNKKERILGITEDNDKMFIRFYDFYSNYINFNILKIDKITKNNELITTRLYPYTHNKILDILAKNNFTLIDYFSGFNFNKTDFLQSDDIIYVCK